MRAKKKKKALIVDDSKLARFVLKEMLQEYGMAADTTESAEEALGYLCSQRPDVIFMDHTMPGMDGFKAVEAIKQDPQTTSIPIMMYTSKEGEMYVSQARALGAIGVLPKQLKSVQLGQVLQKLGLISDLNAAKKASAKTTTTSKPAAKPKKSKKGAVKPQKGEDSTPRANADIEITSNSSNATTQTSARDLELLENLAHRAESSIEVNRLRPLFQDLLNEQRQLLQQDFNKSVVAVSRKFGKEVEVDVNDGDEILITERFRGSQLAAIALVVLIPFLLLLYQYYRIGATLDDIQANSLYTRGFDPVDTTGLYEQVADADQQLIALEAQHEKNNQRLLETLEWALNFNNSVPYGESPLGDKALEILSTLIPTLSEVGFSGTVVLKSYVADFCVIEQEGARHLPAGSKPFTECKLMPQELTESIEFTNYLNTFRQTGNPAIQIRIENRSNTEPLVSYPLPSTVKTAGEWNAAAERNNRIEVELELEREGVALH